MTLRVLVGSPGTCQGLTRSIMRRTHSMKSRQWGCCPVDWKVESIILWLTLLANNRASLVAQSAKNLPAVGDTWVLSLGREDPLEEGNPLQYSCLENSKGRGAWYAIVHGVAKSQTRLKQLSTAQLIKNSTETLWGFPGGTVVRN